jgi:hypothetical protein
MPPPPTTESFGVSLPDLLGRAVRIAGVLVGQVTGVVVDARATRAIGLEIAGAGEAHRFLPWFAARLEEAAVSVESAFLLVDEVGGYERRGAVVVRDPVRLAAFGASADGVLQASGSRAV